MRKILFKAVHKYINKWVEGYYVVWSDNKDYIIQDGCNVDIDSSTLSQYTGLKDSRGVKIFENDFIKLTTNSERYFLIKWDSENCCFVVNTVGSDKSFQLSDLLAKESVVVGNRFDKNN